MSLRWLFGGKPAEDEETEALAAQVAAQRQSATLPDDAAEQAFVMDLMEEVGTAHDITLGFRIGPSVYHLIRSLLAEEPFVLNPQAIGGASSLAEGVEQRKSLRRAQKMLDNEAYYLGKWREMVCAILDCLYRELPEQALVDPDQEGHIEESSILAPVAPLYTYLADVPLLLQRIVYTFCAHDLVEDELFLAVRDRLLIRLAIATGIDPAERYTTDRTPLMPLDNKRLTDGERIDLYLAGTPFAELLMLPIPLHLPEAVRFEHTHILAGTGHGKTQTLQFLIAADLERALAERRSVVVMDSQGDLLDTLMRSDYFQSPTLRERFVYIDPTDLTRPVGLNLFDFDLGSLGAIGPVEREAILNGTFELYEYFFGGLLGAELTQKQGVIFRYLAALLTRIPGANIHTLLQLMQDGERFRPQMATLAGSARLFFETRFFDRGFNETKKQIQNRLWGVLSNGTLDRMMSAKKNSVDLYRTLQDGAVVFINTAKDFMGHEGSAIFGRMFVALLQQALLRRAAIPKHERTPTYIYIDEAQDVVDEMLTRALVQIRKYKGAITFAHQFLDQLEPTIRAGVATNTSIKLAGGLSAKDAHTLAGDFRCEADFLLHQQRGRHETHFACFAKNVTNKAVTLAIPLGYLESRERQSDAAYRALIEGSRARYGVAPEEHAPPQDDIPVPIARPASPPEPLLQPPSSPPPRIEPTIPASDATPNPMSAPMPPPRPVGESREASATVTHTEGIPESPDPGPRRLGPGQGGVKHKYLQHLVKALGEERGFRVALEEPIHDGAGRVDAVLVRGEIALAFEISVTTTNDHELGNIEKCLALPYTHVVMLTSHKRRCTGLSAFIGDALDEKEKKRVSFLLPEDVPGFLDGYPAASVAAGRTVKGYKVTSKVKTTDPTEALARRKAVAAVVARAMQS